MILQTRSCNYALYAGKSEEQDITSLYPSLYLNVAKSYEDLDDFRKAYDYYLLAHSCAHDLPTDGYGNMIRKGIEAGLEKLKGHEFSAFL